MSGRDGRAGSPAVLRRRERDAVALAQQDQFRSVFQHVKGLEGDGLRAVLHPPQQVRAGAGEPGEAVHGEEAAVGEVQLSRAERVLQPVGQGILPVQVTADDGGLPPAGARMQQPYQAQQRFRARRGGAEFLREQRVFEQFQGGAVDLGDLQAERGAVRARGNAAAGRVGLEHGPGRGLPGPCPRFGVGRAGRDRGAWPDGQAGHAEDQGERAVVAQHREQCARDQAQGRGLGVQCPFLLVGMLRGGRRGDRPACQQRFRQALAAQVSQPVLVLPQARPGRDPGRQARLRRARVIARSRRDSDGHGKIRRQRGSCDWLLDSTPNVIAGASSRSRPCRSASRNRDPPVTQH